MSNKVFIFVPAFGQQVQAVTFLTTHALMAEFSQRGIGGGISTLSFPDIAELRNMAVSIWYDTLPDATHILFVDADMGFPTALVFDMLSFGEPLVGTIYPQRRLPISWAGSGTGDPTSERRGNFMKVEGVGMGCTLIHRSVITKMLEEYPEIVDTRLELHPAFEMMKQTGTNRMIRCFDKIDLPERGQVSEDLSFCMRWNKLGGTTWAAIGYKISHVGPFDYCGRYLDMVEAQQAEAERLQSQGVTVDQIAQSTWTGDALSGHALVQINGGTTLAEPMVLVQPTQHGMKVVRGRGRPKGSKNKKSYPQDKQFEAA